MLGMMNSVFGASEKTFLENVCFNLSEFTLYSIEWAIILDCLKSTLCDDVLQEYNRYR